MGKLIDLVGQRFGFWVVIRRSSNSKNGHVRWLCKCECGQEKNVSSNSLRSGNSTSCGCNHTPNLIGQYFGRLIVTNPDSNKNGRRYWLCKCSCGREITVSTYSLREGHITSCGCNLMDLAEESIVISEELSNQCRNNINNSIDLINKQIKVMAEIKQELKSNIKLLASFKSLID